MKLLVATVTLASILPFGSTETVRTVNLGGHEQKLHMYGAETGRPVILASGDGGWMHLAPHLADAAGQSRLLRHRPGCHGAI